MNRSRSAKCIVNGVMNLRTRLTAALSAAALFLSLGLFGCGGGSAPDGSSSESAASTESNSAQSRGAWTIDKATDDFGDELEDGRTYIACPIEGEFSNSATTGSEFAGRLWIWWSGTVSDKDTLAYAYAATIQILEYGDNPATFSSSSDIVLRTKNDSGIIRQYLASTTPNEEGVTCFEANRLVFDLLEEPSELRCILNDGSSKYEFTLSGAGFAETFAENRPEALKAMADEMSSSLYGGQKLQSDEDALEMVMPEQTLVFDRQAAACWLTNSAFDYPKLTAEEIKSLFPGTYVMMQLTDPTGQTIGSQKALKDNIVLDFDSEGTASYLGTIHVEDDHVVGSKDTISNQRGDGGTLYTTGDVGDGTIAMTLTTTNGQRNYLYEVRKVAKGYYLLRMLDSTQENQELTDVTFLLYSCDSNPIEDEYSHSTEEALERVVIDDGHKDDYAAFYLAEHLQDYKVLGQSEIEELFPGTYVLEDAWLTDGKGGTNGGYVYEFANDGTCKQIALMPSAGTFKDTSNSKGVSLKLYAIEEGRLLKRPDYSDDWRESYEVRKVADGFYALVDENGDMRKLMYPYKDSK